MVGPSPKADGEGAVPGFLGPLEWNARGAEECGSTLTPMSTTSFVMEENSSAYVTIGRISSRPAADS
jgi:hypothetical protein